MPNDDLISGISYGTFKVWDLNKKTIKYIFNNNKSSVDRIRVLNNGDLAMAYIINSLASLSESLFAVSVMHSIIVYNYNNETVKFNLTGHTNIIYTILLLSNGNLASCSADQTIKIWNLLDGSLRKTLIGHTAFVYSLVKLSNGDLVSCSSDKSIIIWKRSLIEN